MNIFHKYPLSQYSFRLLRKLLYFSLFLFFFSAGHSPLISAQTNPVIVYDGTKAKSVRFELSGDALNWNVYLPNSNRPIAGQKRSSGSGMEFIPLVSFQPELNYEVRIAGKTIYTFHVEYIRTVSPAVKTVYPSSGPLPANILKFYIEFSQPMSEGDPYQSIRMLDRTGKEVSDVFLQQLPALWNAERTMLTLWLDPGRIKRDLKLNQLYGNPLEAEESYQIIIDTTLTARNGMNLARIHTHSFETTQPDRVKPDAASWNTEIPIAKSRSELKLNFNETMDLGSVSDRIEVLKAGNPVSGVSRLTDNQQGWVFYPESAWASGDYIIRVDSRAEDLAGNNLNRLFDRDINTEGSGNNRYHEIKFQIR